MKKLIALASAGLLALAFAAPVAADTFVDGNLTEKADVRGDSLDGYILVCTYPGQKDLNWVVNGQGNGCLTGTGPAADIGPGMLKLLPEAALGGMIVE